MPHREAEPGAACLPCDKTRFVFLPRPRSSQSVVPESGCAPRPPPPPLPPSPVSVRELQGHASFRGLYDRFRPASSFQRRVGTKHKKNGSDITPDPGGHWRTGADTCKTGSGAGKRSRAKCTGGHRSQTCAAFGHSIPTIPAMDGHRYGRAGARHGVCVLHGESSKRLATPRNTKQKQEYV